MALIGATPDSNGATTTAPPPGSSALNPDFNGVVPGFSTDSSGNIIQAGGGTTTGGYFPNATGGLFPTVPGLAGPAPNFAQAPPPAAPSAPPLATQPGGAAQASALDLFPDYQNSLALQQAGMSQLDANLNQQRQQAIINFGDPALAQMAGFGLDPQAGAFAQQNYLSGNATLARLDKQHQLASRAIINQLAAHGILNSGELGYDQGQENQGYGNNVYDAQQSVLQQLAQLYSTYLGQRGQLQDNTNSSQLQALQAFLSNPDSYAGLFGPQTQTTASAPAKVTAKAPAKAKAPADTLSRYLGNKAK